MQAISLYELTLNIGESFRCIYETPVWITAEISEIRENQNGHCYLELIDKNEASDNIVAKIKATIWNNTYRLMKPYFEGNTGETLRNGIKVMLGVTVEFHPVYGLSLNVKDIDPTYTVGELAAKRLQIIHRLEADGIMEMNKQLEMPELPQRIAIISSPTAAGYDDFCNQLTHSNPHYSFYTRLFPSIMQGDAAESSMIQALEKIYACVSLFDVVVIIRGGGASTDLSCFDSYDLACNCAQFPLPVIAGIGHQRDVSILDMVAHTSVKTPTAAAAFILEKMNYAFGKITEYSYSIKQITVQNHHLATRKLETTQWKLNQSLKSYFSKKNIDIEKNIFRLKSAANIVLSTQKSNLLLIEKNITMLSPEYLYRKGYTITTVNGKRITSKTQVKPGDTMKTYLRDGKIDSSVSEIN